MKNSIRKGAAIGSVAAGLGAAIALALVPGTALAHEWSWPDSKPASGEALAQAVAAQSAECQAAVKALADWRVTDRQEDMDEKLLAQSPGWNDVTEDQQEKAAVMALWDTIRAACAPQAATTAGAPPSDACVAAKQNFKNAVAAQIATEKAERANGTEGKPADVAADKQEAAQLKALWDAKHAACGSQFANKAPFAEKFAGWQHHSDRR